ncbi:D-isomer specific 2-hydroxyacid dehydrogenase [Hyaloraphidium curvatum]|nr:D-isomer specific 2-hydroxyacid dehydrogenase [Hyaloraphidium curvatum]
MAAAETRIPFLCLPIVGRVLFGATGTPRGVLPVVLKVDYPSHGPPRVSLEDDSQRELADKAQLFVGPFSGSANVRPAETVDAVLDAFPHVRRVHIAQVGLEHVMTANYLRKGNQRDVILTNARGANAAPIAEFVLMFMLAKAKLARHYLSLPAPDPSGPAPDPYSPEPLDVRERTDFWKGKSRQMEMSELLGRTVFVIGLGSIGAEVARRCAAGFGMRVWGSKQTPGAVPHVENVFGDRDWKVPEVLGEVDFLVCAAPLTEGTREVVDDAVLGMLKKGAYVINVGRGALISTPALLRALDSSNISGAALDVHDPDEPPSTYSPLWKYHPDRVWMTPHVAWSGEGTLPRTAEGVAREVLAAARGEPPINPVPLG